MAQVKPQEIAQRLKQTAQAAGLSSAAIGARLGVKPSTVRSWWSGQNEPSASLMAAYAQAVGRSIGYLITGQAAREFDLDAPLPVDAEPIFRRGIMEVMRFWPLLADGMVAIEEAIDSGESTIPPVLFRVNGKRVILGPRSVTLQPEAEEPAEAAPPGKRPRTGRADHKLEPCRGCGVPLRPDQVEDSLQRHGCVLCGDCRSAGAGTVGRRQRIVRRQKGVANQDG